MRREAPRNHKTETFAPDVEEPPHSRMQCPARDAVCHNCSAKGHFKSMCRSKTTVNNVSELDNKIAFLDVVHVQSDAAAEKAKGQPWMVNPSFNNYQKVFKIDTMVPCQHLDEFKGKLRHGNTEVGQEIYVVRGLNQALVRRLAIEAFKLTVKVEPVETPKEAVISKFPHLFKGLGKLEGVHKIALKDNAKPFAYTTPRRIALPLFKR